MINLLINTRFQYTVTTDINIFKKLHLQENRYLIIVFENMYQYLSMDKRIRRILDNYCKKNSIGIIGFLKNIKNNINENTSEQLNGFPVYIKRNIVLQNVSLNQFSKILRITKAGNTNCGILPIADWIVLEYNHSTYESIEWAQHNAGTFNTTYTTILHDRGSLDGIQRIFFGSDLKFWLHHLIFLDILSYLSHGNISLSLSRAISVDIDNVFNNASSSSLKETDIIEFIATQQRIANIVDGFQFNLGFSGGGILKKNLRDNLLLKNINKFKWFPNMWLYKLPHLYDNLTTLIDDMKLNYQFAKRYGIPTNSNYAVTPQHSGIYPVHELLYTAWQKVWNIKVTSTEEYPNLRPASLRRGFIYRNIMVLPRNNLSLLSQKNTYCKQHCFKLNKFDDSIQGGKLLDTILYNPINIFMTHGSDLVALNTLESVLKCLRRWTNLIFSSSSPLQLGIQYFRLYPKDVQPIWVNPCFNPSHIEKWLYRNKCSCLPKILIIGPQRTGTTALYTFLSMHPNLFSNIKAKNEEIQFFNDHNYFRGLYWYLNFFHSYIVSKKYKKKFLSEYESEPHSFNRKILYTFEKSATYFADKYVPKRAFALLPYSKIIITLISPDKRAYSLYQNEKSNGEITANLYTFYQVITANQSASEDLKYLRNRCLHPGIYVEHIKRWLTYYSSKNLYIIDGAQLQANPIPIMNKLQRYLKLPFKYDYAQNLRFNKSKGFYCQKTSMLKDKCLPTSKGHNYSAMDNESLKFLHKYYFTHNIQLFNLLKQLKSLIPQWLISYYS